METEKLDELKGLLRKVAFGHLLPEKLFGDLLPKFYPISFADGERVLQQGTTAGAFIIISRGALEVKVMSESHQEVTVKTLKRGDYVGEMALISGTTRNATVIAHGPVEAFLLSKSAFAFMVKEAPPVHEFLKKSAEKREKDTKKKAGLEKGEKPLKGLRSSL
ncbi:MAG: cyclic nucleotide-binding domain-containing protein [Candidatus Eremiobacteraeota bacterium]|nr:cyclic nucleotide-binding domain-containing protein [Candidatus Eremiobacteraeota bacterium]